MRALAALALCACAAAAAAPPRPEPPLPGTHFLGSDLKALQADDFANPGQLWVARGEALWSEGAKPCAACHGEAARSMRGAAARYPRFDAGLGRVVNLEGRIDACRTGRQGLPAFAPESPERLALAAFVARQSRGMPFAVSVDGPARPVFERGRDLYRTRIGQLNLACTHCHDERWGKTLLAEPISQGHPSAWPAYRVEWQTLGSLQRRLRACFFGVRAAMPDYGDGDLLALELYLAWRGEGLALESPGVRR